MFTFFSISSVDVWRHIPAQEKDEKLGMIRMRVVRESQNDLTLELEYSTTIRKKTVLCISLNVHLSLLVPFTDLHK